MQFTVGRGKIMKPKGISNETLAAMLRTMCATGICATNKEREYLREAADRLEENEVEILADKLGVKLDED